MCCPSRPVQKGVGRRHGRWAGCDGRESCGDDRSLSVRQRRVVPTPRRWRPCTWETSDFPGRHGGKRAVLRGELVISRKAIAQGRPGVLRCPVCSCAHFLVHIAHETAGAARTRSFLRPLNREGGKFPAKLGRNASRECENIFSRRHPPECAIAHGGRMTQYSRDDSDKSDGSRRTGSPRFRGG
jgi:hypothetical protein